MPRSAKKQAVSAPVVPVTKTDIVVVNMTCATTPPASPPVSEEGFDPGLLGTGMMISILVIAAGAAFKGLVFKKK